MLEEGCTQNVWAPRTIYGKLINSRTFTGICGDLVGLCVSRTMYVSKIGSCRMENAPRYVHLRCAGWSKGLAVGTSRICALSRLNRDFLPYSILTIRLPLVPARKITVAIFHAKIPRGLYFTSID